MRKHAQTGGVFVVPKARPSKRHFYFPIAESVFQNGCIFLVREWRQRKALQIPLTHPVIDHFFSSQHNFFFKDGRLRGRPPAHLHRGVAHQAFGRLQRHGRLVGQHAVYFRRRNPRGLLRHATQLPELLAHFRQIPQARLRARGGWTAVRPRARNVPALHTARAPFLGKMWL